MDNWGPDYRDFENSTQTFFSVFAIFFPSVTGIQAGANISGDLKDPASSIPMGTLLALLISMTSYVTFVFFAGSAAVRDATGNITNGIIQDCLPSADCSYGLHNSYSVRCRMSHYILTYLSLVKIPRRTTSELIGTSYAVFDVVECIECGSIQRFYKD